MTRSLGLVLMIGAWGGALFCSAAAPSSPLTNVSQVLSLSADDAAHALPVRLQATVTYANGDNLLFVEDGTGGIFVGTEQKQPSLRSGQVIEIEGRSDRGVHLRAIVRATVKALNRTEQIGATPVSWDQLESGAFDCRRVELRGVARWNGQRGARFALGIVVGDDHYIEATFLSRCRAPNLLDATVRVRGVCGVGEMKDGRVLSLVIYGGDGDADITVEKPGLSGPFAARLMTLTQALQPTNALQRVRIRSTVVEATENEVLVRDATGTSLRVEVRPPAGIRTNDLVEISGWLARRHAAAVMKHAYLRIFAPRLFSTNAADVSPLLMRAADVRRLSAPETHRASPVRLRGVITYYDGDSLLFVQDQSAGIYIDPEDNQKFEVRTGDLVEVDGFTGSGMFAPVVRNARTRVLNQVALPAPKTVPFAELLTGQEDSQRLEIAGVVRSSVQEANQLVLDVVAAAGGRITAFVLLNGASAPTNLVDAAVRLVGVCATEYNAKRQLTGLKLFVPGLRDLKIEEAAPADPFSIPTASSASLLQFGTNSRHRVKFAGTVTYLDASPSLLCLRDADGGVFAQLKEPGGVKIGDRVEVIGFPSTSDSSARISEALVRVAGSGSAPTPLPITVEQALSRTNEAELVSMEGRLLDQFTRGHQHVLVLQQSNSVFEAQLPPTKVSARVLDFENGSLLRVTGICSLQTERATEPRALRLLMRSSDDAVLLRAAPWWNPHRARMAFASALTLILGSTVWVAVLRRKVRKQTALIQLQLDREKHVNDQLESKVQERTAELSRANRLLTQQIEERRRTDEMLALERDLFHTIMENVPAAIFFKDAEGRFTKINKALAQHFKLATPDLVAGKTDEDFFEAEQVKVFRQQETEIMQTGRSMIEVEEHGVLEGREWWGITTKMPLRDARGKVVGIFGISHDITRRKQAERDVEKARQELEARVEQRTAELSSSNAALRQSEERFSKAFRSSPVPMCISTQAEGRFIDANDALARMLGYTRDEMIGRTSIELGLWLRPEDRARVIQQLREQKPVREWEYQFRTKTGELRDALYSVETIQLGDENCIIFILHDITERKSLEAQLRHSQKLEAVGQLAAGIAHDFNNILTVIQGHANLLIADAEQAGGNNDALKEILEAAERAANLTRQLLAFSRRQLLKPRALDINEVISGVSKMLRRVLGEQVLLRLHQPSSLPAIHADPGMIEQIIMNLAVNARDAMPHGGELTFSTEVRHITDDNARQNAEASPGLFVCLSVKDTGCGMDEATMARIFEPFFTTKAVCKGTGLGLATVYGIVKQHQGWIEVSSTVGVGTTFEVFLPARGVVESAAAAAAWDNPERGGHETILLVEDEPGVRLLAQRILQRSGYQVLTASTGREAVEVWKSHANEIQLLLTDMVMPEGMTGRELAEQLRTARPNLKVIYSSGYSVELIDQGITLHDGINFLPKPYHPGKLISAVRNCLDV